MKQRGKTWHTAGGYETLSQYLPAHDIVHEKLGQKIAADAEALETRLRIYKEFMLKMCKKAMAAHPDKSPKTRFSFHTFDREFKIEFDVQTENIRVYRALKGDPGPKDYEIINMDFSKVPSTEGEFTFEKKEQPTPEPQKEEPKDGVLEFNKAINGEGYNGPNPRATEEIINPLNN